MKLHSIKADVEKMEDGVWERITEDFEVRVGHQNTPAYTAFLHKHARGHGRAFLKGTLDAKAIESITPLIKEATARHLLLDWRGLQDDDGEEIPFSTKKAVELLTDPAYSSLFTMITEISQDETLFRAVQDEDDAGNS